MMPLWISLANSCIFIQRCASRGDLQQTNSSRNLLVTFANDASLSDLSDDLTEPGTKLIGWLVGVI